MNDVMGTIRNMVWNLTHRIRVVDVIDILIVAIIIYELLLLTRHTRGSALLKGLFLLLIIAFLSNLLGLVSLNWLLNAILQNGAVVLVILFQPELRKALERMGRSRVFKKGPKKSQDEERDTIISEIIQTIMDLSKRRVGALIVFEQQTGLQDVIEFKKQFPDQELILHSDQGSVYASKSYNELLPMYNITRSMSRAGTPTDNAAMESINGWVKTELFTDFHITSNDDVSRQVDDYIRFFNEERPAYTLGYLTPKQYRERFAQKH